MSAESQQSQLLTGNVSVDTPDARQWFSGRHVIAATGTHAALELLVAMFSVRSVPGLYNVYQLPLRVQTPCLWVKPRHSVPGGCKYGNLDLGGISSLRQ
jgi:hypothetical protein